jgi:hypothetical protein
LRSKAQGRVLQVRTARYCRPRHASAKRHALQAVPAPVCSLHVPLTDALLQHAYDSGGLPVSCSSKWLQLLQGQTQGNSRIKIFVTPTSQVCHTSATWKQLPAS